MSETKLENIEIINTDIIEKPKNSIISTIMSNNMYIYIVVFCVVTDS